MMRTDWHTYFLDIALRCAKQGTCRRRNRGAIIVDEHRRIISTGYTGVVSGAKHCTELGMCMREHYNIPPGSNYEFCRSVHAEMNALLQAGIDRARGCYLYLAGVNPDGSIIEHDAPCLLCAKLIVQCQIKAVVILQADGSYNIHHPAALLSFRSAEAIDRISMMPTGGETTE